MRGNDQCSRGCIIHRFCQCGFYFVFFLFFVSETNGFSLHRIIKLTGNVWHQQQHGRAINIPKISETNVKNKCPIKNQNKQYRFKQQKITLHQQQQQQSSEYNTSQIIFLWHLQHEPLQKGCCAPQGSYSVWSFDSIALQQCTISDLFHMHRGFLQSASWLWGLANQ